MYADFEEILKAIEGPSPNPEVPYTKEINKHIPSGFCVKSKFAYGEVENSLKLYRGEDCIESFCDYIVNKAERLYHKFPEKAMKPPTRKEWKEFNRARKCYMYFKEFQVKEKLYPKVRDHCHYSGWYRGPAHSNCNLRYKIRSYILIVFHNLSRYNAHLFIRELGKKFNTGKIGVIAEHKKYISFSVDVATDWYEDKSG